LGGFPKHNARRVPHSGLRDEDQNRIWLDNSAALAAAVNWSRLNNGVLLRDFNDKIIQLLDLNANATGLMNS